MTKSIKLIKSTIIVAMLLVSLFTISVSMEANAFTLPKLNSNIDVSWGEELAKPVVPRDEVRKLNLSIKHKVDSGGDIASGALSSYMGYNALIELTIVECSSWCIANLGSTIISIPLSTEYKEEYVFLNIQLQDDAPAYGAEGYITLRASVNSGSLGLIGGFSEDFTLNFLAEYLPRINVDMLEGTTKRVSPMESAIFPIKISNMGNARTTVFFEIEDIPEGWTVAVTDDVTLGDTEGSIETAYLTVSPPRGFGYHYDTEDIRVIMTPARAEDLTNKGEPSYFTVIVESRGFSTPGFELVIFAFALVAVVLITKKVRKK